MTLRDEISDKIATDEEVGRRIAARRAAEEVASLADEEAVIHGKLFWIHLHRICSAHVPCERDDKKPRRAMSEAESKLFGNQFMPFGEFEGVRIDEVPLDRLVWYAEQTFTEKLRRYIASRRVQDEAKTDD